MVSTTESQPLPLPTPGSQFFARWQRKAQARAWLGAPVLLISAAAIGGTLGVGPLLLCLAGGCLVAAILALWGSLLVALEESEPSLDDALAFYSSSAEDEKKQSVLRALKDLDYERALGKLSEADFERLRAQYRAEARALIGATAPSSPAFEQAKRALALELSAAPRKAEADLQPTPSTPVDHPCCPQCNGLNDPDAKFCKHCGKPLSSPANP